MAGTSTTTGDGGMTPEEGRALKKQMEASLGAHLCDRTPEGYRLTAAGQSLVALAERTEQDVLAAEARIVCSAMAARFIPTHSGLLLY